MKSNPVLINLCLLIGLILFAVALYYIPLRNASFYFDDRSAIANNPVIKTIDIPKIFDAFNTRFLPGLSFALNYQWCGLHPAGFRLINLLIHGLNSWLIFLILKSVLKTFPAAVFGALLFLCHPIQTEAVNSITQRFVLMGSFFYMLTLYLYIQYRQQEQKIYFICALGTAVAAMFCKEFTVTLPLMLALYEFYFGGPSKEMEWKRCRRLAAFFAVTLIVPLLLLRTPHDIVRQANIADSNPGQHHIDITRAKNAIGRGQYFLTEINVVRTYVRLLVFPINQNFDYDYPLSRGMDARTFCSGLFLLCLLIAAAAMYKYRRLASFGILWFFIALSVESSFIPIGHVIAEYRLYLAGAGFVFLVTDLLFTPQNYRKILNSLAAAILIVFSIMTWQRNEIWKDEFTLWNDTVQKSPHKARAYINRGLEYYRQGKISQSMADFNKAIELKPDYAAAYNDRGVLFAIQGKVTLAISDFNEAVKINPNYPDAFNNLQRALGH